MTSGALDVPPLDARAYAMLAAEGFGDEFFHPRQHVACELVERYATARAADLARTLDLGAFVTGTASPEALCRERGWSPRIVPALAWLRARLGGAEPVGSSAELRRAGLAADASYAPAYDLLDETAAAFPAIARGETTGEQALLGKLALWIRYFDNRNAYYALNNRVAARAAADRLPAGARVLEVGAGLGSASEALLDDLGARAALGHVATYHATEPVPFFARRAERVLRGLHPALALTFAALDVNQPWAAQGIEAGSRDLVWGVNVFHLAHDLDAVLGEARAALAPGGWLVVGEGMRPAPGAVVGAEFPFRLLDSFTGVRLDPATRPLPGFLTAEQWLAALGRAGFADVRVVPDVIALRVHYSGMLAAAACGRRS